MGFIIQMIASFSKVGDNAIHKVVLAQKCDNNSQGFQYKNPPPTLPDTSVFTILFLKQIQFRDSEDRLRNGGGVIKKILS